MLLAALITLGSVAGFLLYQCGLTRAKNSGHTATVLFLGVVFALTGYWIGGFAVQMGGVGDVHAALMGPLSQEAAARWTTSSASSPSAITGISWATPASSS
ncbi:MAG: hypothetical protein WDO13_02015 [Verrucomicrobiota bacterium]